MRIFTTDTNIAQIHATRNTDWTSSPHITKSCILYEVCGHIRYDKCAVDLHSKTFHFLWISTDLHTVNGYYHLAFGNSPFTTHRLFSVWSLFCDICRRWNVFPDGLVVTVAIPGNQLSKTPNLSVIKSHSHKSTGQW
jgi:hypothetical protein